MAKAITTEKGFKVIEMGIDDLMNCECGTMGVCDYCNVGLASPKGGGTPIYYVAVLNQLYCKSCYEDWLNEAKYCESDAEFEDANFAEWKLKLAIAE